MDLLPVLTAIAEPTRFRIVRLLALAPRTVGEVATALGALQPQTTKHIQILEAAGVVTVHKLGRRRVVTLDRNRMRELADEVAKFVVPTEGDGTVDAYARAIAAEQTLADIGADATRDLRIERRVHAPLERVWRAWTEPAVVRRWWAPEHFEVTESEIAPVAGAPIRIVMREADGAEYTSAGRVIEAHPMRRLVFELSPLGRDGEALFRSTLTLSLSGDDPVDQALDIRVSQVTPEAVSALAGLELGWDQLLAKLARLLTHSPQPR